ncbi:MAG: hypothetical protein KKF54_00465 [Candidatus Omnitrophica bacterium]|nr:hypothetical protein [Candidatus Omnitrophota bacterium]
MGNISNGMESICSDIVNSHEERNKSLKDLQKGVKSLRNDAKEFVADSGMSRKEMAKKLDENLSLGRQDLTKAVNSLKKDFHNNQKAVRQDLTQARKTWQGLKKAKAEKKSKS